MVVQPLHSPFNSLISIHNKETAPTFTRKKVVHEVLQSQFHASGDPISETATIYIRYSTLPTSVRNTDVMSLRMCNEDCVRLFQAPGLFYSS